MLDSRVAEGRDRDTDARDRGRGLDPQARDPKDDKLRADLDKPGLQDGHGPKVEKISALAGGNSKKTMIDRVNLGQDEPQNEVERLIQQKLLQKKLSGQGSSSSENNRDVQPKTGNEAVVSDYDILNQFRGVEMDDGLESDDRKQPGANKQLPDRGNNHKFNQKNENKHSLEDYGADDEAGDEHMMGIWGGPKDDEHSN